MCTFEIVKLLQPKAVWLRLKAPDISFQKLPKNHFHRKFPAMFSENKFTTLSHHTV